jgi:ribosomal protein S18 acetylase RimI-like enzyme
MAIRGATIADAEALARVHVASWQAAYRGIMPDAFLDALSVVGFQSRWEELFQGGTQVTLVSEIDNRIRGFAGFGPSRDADTDSGTAELCGLYVHPENWGCGLGKALCRAALSDLGEQGYRDVILWVLAVNQRARGFYQRLGFRPQPGGGRIYQGFGLALPEVRYAYSLS